MLVSVRVEQDWSPGPPEQAALWDTRKEIVLRLETFTWAALCSRNSSLVFPPGCQGRICRCIFEAAALRPRVPQQQCVPRLTTPQLRPCCGMQRCEEREQSLGKPPLHTACSQHLKCTHMPFFPPPLQPRCSCPLVRRFTGELAAPGLPLDVFGCY